MARRSGLILTALAATALALPATAAAQDPAPTPAPTPAPVASPPPVGGTLTLAAERVGGADRAVVAGDRWRVRGRVAPYVPGQRVVVRLLRGHQKLVVREVAVRRAGDGSSGTFLVGLSSGRPGRVTVLAVHRRTPGQATLRSPAVRVSVLAAHVAPGARGAAVRVLQRGLAALGYVVGRRGTFDARTERAVLAFRKVTGMARTMVADAEVFHRLARGSGHFRVRHPDHGKHVEADLSRQVLALIDGDRVERIYPTSSGAPVTRTVLGSFRVYLKSPGINQKGMYYSSYFIRGYAIHGYVSVPAYPASHGCLRVPLSDAIPIFRWLSVGDVVDVYR
jgi:peptidoglycan hydrolase-like protein with peptidoglycan-binding domain